MKPFATIALCLLFSTAWAAEPGQHTNIPVVQRPTLKDVLTSFGDTVIPAAWSGIWDFSNTDIDCITQQVTGSDADTDTLCTGQDLNPGGKLDCIGSITDTTVNVTCSGQMEIFPGCNVTFTYTLAATRNGDNLTSTSTFLTDYSPDGCAFVPDECTETQSTATRVAQEPPNCLTSVDSFSWGRVKAIYR
jgi:hypothetical protein